MKRKHHGKRRDRREQRMLYFAYGSNMHTEQMSYRSPDAKVLGTATLHGWRLVFRGVADIVADPEHDVPGLLWSITPADLRALDRYEGYPTLYTRFVVEVETDDGPAQAWVYVMVNDSTLGLPSKPYLRTCLTGLSAWGLPVWHLRRALKDAAEVLLDAGYTEDDLVRVGKRYVPRDQVRERTPVRGRYTSAGDALDAVRGQRSDDGSEWVDTGSEFGWVPIEQVMSMSPATRRAFGPSVVDRYNREMRRRERAGRRGTTRR